MENWNSVSVLVAYSHTCRVKHLDAESNNVSRHSNISDHVSCSMSGGQTRLARPIERQKEVGWQALLEGCPTQVADESRSSSTITLSGAEKQDAGGYQLSASSGRVAWDMWEHRNGIAWQGTRTGSTVRTEQQGYEKNLRKDVNCWIEIPDCYFDRDWRKFYETISRMAVVGMACMD
jgi:hypothetical protein